MEQSFRPQIAGQLTNEMLRLLVILFCCSTFAESFQCRDSNGNDVDWWYIYKLPKISKHTSEIVNRGLAYLYQDRASAGNWQLSSASIRDPGPLSHTMQQLYSAKDQNQTTIYYAMYNDDHPGKKLDSYRAHAKGLHLFDISTGFWLIHSVPEFAPLRSFDYPDNGRRYGQSMLCVTFNTSATLDKLGDIMSFMQPSVYSFHIDQKFADDYPMLKSVIGEGYSRRRAPFNHQQVLTSLGGTEFTSFSKHRKWGKDLYKDQVAPALGSSLLVETWLKGPGDLVSDCTSTYHTMNLRQVKPDDVSFGNSKDHSKWAIGETDAWVCIGDINRQSSQDERGGGTLCQRNVQVWNTYKAAVQQIEPCPTPTTTTSSTTTTESTSIFGKIKNLFCSKIWNVCK